MLTFLTENHWVTSVLLAGAVITSPVVGLWLSRRPGVALAVTIASLVVVLLVVFAPVDRELFAVCSNEWSPPALGRVELVSNFLLFLPLTLAGGVATRKPIPCALAASMLSLGIEVAQAAAPVIGRSCSTNDWLYNTLGAIAGALLALVSLSLAHRSNGHAPAPGEGPEDERSRQT